jgi:hypothetical protein
MWPSFFLLGPNWPQDGEIDVIEGVNMMPHNQITIHTRGGCVPGIGPGGERGVRMGHKDCGADGGFIGCGVSHNVGHGYGAGMNAAGGGVYATLWTDDGIKVWQWPRRQTPRDALGQNPDPARWGQPVANWGGGCNFKDSFKDMHLVRLSTRALWKPKTDSTADSAIDLLWRLGWQGVA